MKLKSLLICCVVALASLAISQEGKAQPSDMRTFKGCVFGGLPDADQQARCAALCKSEYAFLGSFGGLGCRDVEKPCLCPPNS